MPRHKKEVELKKWVSIKKICIAVIEFKIESLNKEVCVLADCYLSAEMMLSKKYPTATKVEVIKIYDNITC